MLIELRKMRQKGGKSRSLGNYIGNLQARGKIERYYTAENYICFDTEEYKEYKRSARRGRPRKDGTR